MRGLLGIMASAPAPAASSALVLPLITSTDWCCCSVVVAACGVPPSAPVPVVALFGAGGVCCWARDRPWLSLVRAGAGPMPAGGGGLHGAWAPAFDKLGVSASGSLAGWPLFHLGLALPLLTRPLFQAQAQWQPYQRLEPGGKPGSKHC